LFAFCFYEIDFTVTGTEAWTQMCASAGGFAMGCNPTCDDERPSKTDPAASFILTF
jgi:hypothetical protein